MSITTRHLPLEGAYNVRELGGYATADGRITRWQSLLRADSLDALSAKARQQLLDYGIRTIIDLRSNQEVELEPNVFAGSSQVQYVHIPLLGETNNGDSAHTPRDLLTIYKHILDNCQTRIVAVMRTFLSEGDTPALVHCSAGKDRTGVISALMLALAGVDDETIAHDYALTGYYLKPKFDRYRQKAAAAGRDMEAFELLLLSEPQTMLDTLQYLQNVYRGAAAYLSQIGLNDLEIDQLRFKILS
jgi:protein-tyrosine phosphatase